jgi:hypothetical protein
MNELERLILELKITQNELKRAVGRVCSALARSIKVQAANAAGAALKAPTEPIRKRIVAIASKRDEMVSKVIARGYAIPTILFGARQTPAGVSWGRSNKIKSAFIARPQHAGKLDNFVFKRKTSRPYPLQGFREQIYEPLDDQFAWEVSNMQARFNKMLMRELMKKKFRGKGKSLL